MVCRERELAQLDTAVVASSGGSSTALVIGGEAGVGKTSLVREFIERCSARGFMTLYGRCVELIEASVPFAPFAEAFRRLVRAMPADNRDCFLGTHRGDLVGLLPELATESDHAPPVADPSAQGRLFGRLHALLLRLSEDCPVVLVLEDMHWADRSTLDLVTFLIPNLAKERVLPVCTYRADELYPGHPLSPVLAELERSRSIEWLNLDRFERDELANLLESLLGYRPDKALVDRIFARSGGNAFFAEELLAAPSESEGPTLQLPPTLRDVLLARVDRFIAGGTGRTRGCVRRWPSAAGPVVCEHLPAQTSTTRSGAARGSGTPHTRNRRRRQLRVPPRALREAVYDRLLPAERSALHAAYAGALESCRDKAAVAEIAYHWHRANDAPRALAASVVAAEAASAAFGFAEAQRTNELAVELSDDVANTAVLCGLDKVSLICRAAEAANLAGEHGRAASLVKGAVTLVSGEPVRAGLLHERLARYLWAAGDSSAALEAYAEAVRLVPPRPPSRARARVLAAHGQALMLMARYSESRERCQEAVAIARTVGARPEEGHALNTLGYDLTCLGEAELGVQSLREALTIAEEVGDLDDLARAHLNLSELLAGPLNRPGEALALALDGIQLLGRVGLSRDYGVSLSATAAGALYVLGRWDEALSLLQEAERQVPVEAAAIDLHQARLKLLVSRGEVDRARQELDLLGGLMTHTVDPQYEVPLCTREAELALWEGRPADARVAVAEGLEHLANTDDVWFAGPLIWLGMWADVDDKLEARMRRTTAEQPTYRPCLTERLQLVLRRLRDEQAFVPPATLGYVLLCEGELSRLRAEPGPEAWRLAADEWQRLGHRFPAAYARWREAEMLLAARRAQAAQAPLRTAFSVANSLGAEPLKAQAKALADACTARSGDADVADRTRPRRRARADAAGVAGARASGRRPDQP